MSNQEEGKGPTKHRYRFLTCQPNKSNLQQNRQTLNYQPEQTQNQQNLQDPNYQEQKCKFGLDEVDYDLTLEKIIVNQYPDNPIYVDQGNTWYYVDDQKLIQKEDGRYMPLYQNDQGGQANIDLNIIEQWGIKITCIFDHYCYTGMLTEQEINLDQQIMTIDDVFDELIDDFNKPELINQENESIRIHLNDQIMELTQTLQMKKGKNQVLQAILRWNLLRQKDEEIVEKKINFLQQEIKQLKNQSAEFLNKVQDLDSLLKQNLLSAQTNQTQIMQNLQTLQDQQTHQQLKLSQQNSRFNSSSVTGVTNSLKEIQPKSPIKGREAIKQEFDKNKNLEEEFHICLDKVDYHLKLQKINCKFPELIFFSDYGTKWHYVNDQDRKQIPQFKNEVGFVATIDKNFIDQRLIKITCNYDDYCYTGMLTEQEIEMAQKQEILTMDEVFDELLEEFQKHQLIKYKDGSINLQKNNDDGISLKIQMKKGNNIATEFIRWNLLRQKDEQIIEKKIIGIQQRNDQILQKLEQQEMKQTQIMQHLQTLNEQLTQKQNDQKIQKSSDLGFFRFSTKSNFEIQDYCYQQQQQQYQITNKELQENSQQLQKQLSAEFRNNVMVQVQQQNVFNKFIIDKLKEEFEQNIQRLKEQQSAEFKLQMKDLVDLQLQQSLQEQKQQQQYFNTKFQELQQNIQQFQEELSAIIQNNIKEQLNQQQELNQALNNEQQKYYLQLDALLKEHQIQPQIRVKPSGLIKTSEYFFVSPQCVKGVTTLEFTIKALNSSGLVIGLDNTTNPVNNIPMYSFYLNHQLSVTGKAQTQTQLQYVQYVGDQICLKVDMNQRIIVFYANQQVIIQFPLDDDLGETEWYICVGYFQRFEEINDFIE